MKKLLSKERKKEKPIPLRFNMFKKCDFFSLKILFNRKFANKNINRLNPSTIFSSGNFRFHRLNNKLLSMPHMRPFENFQSLEINCT